MSSIQLQGCKVFNWIETNECSCLCLFCCNFFIFIIPDQNYFFCKCITPPTLHDAGCSLASDKSHQNLDQASAQSCPLIIWSQVIDCLQRKHFSSHTAQMFHNFRSHKIWYIWRPDRYLDMWIDFPAVFRKRISVHLEWGIWYETLSYYWQHKIDKWKIFHPQLGFTNISSILTTYSIKI